MRWGSTYRELKVGAACIIGLRSCGMEQYPLAPAEWRLHLIIKQLQNTLEDGPVQTDQPQIIIQLAFPADIVGKPIVHFIAIIKLKIDHGRVAPLFAWIGLKTIICYHFNVSGFRFWIEALTAISLEFRVALVHGLERAASLSSFCSIISRDQPGCWNQVGSADARREGSSEGL